MTNNIVIREALARLHEEDRNLLHLKASGLSGDEIAQALDIPASTARSRLSRAKKRFKIILAEFGVECL